MTYWLYHILFTLPLLAALLWVMRTTLTTAHAICMGITAVIAFAFTTPWDNYAVFLGIWSFGDAVSLGYPLHHLSDHTSWLGHIPVEEYAFFVIETLLACLTVTFFIQRQKTRETPIAPR